MKILVVHNSLNDSKSLSGALRHFLVMANEWTAMGHQTDFLCAKCAFPQIRELAPHAGLISSDNLFDATQHQPNLALSSSLRVATNHLPLHTIAREIRRRFCVQSNPVRDPARDGFSSTIGS